MSVNTAAGVQALKSAGQNAVIEVVAGVDHFDLIERLTDPDYSLSRVSCGLHLFTSSSHRRRT